MAGAVDPSRDQQDLGAMMARILPRLAALEEPVLRAAGLSMWEYAILTEVATSIAVSQRELSLRTRRDPTRLGRHIDEMVSRGLVTRERSRDQRQRAVGITPTGRELLQRVQMEISAVENELLASAMLSTDAAHFRHLLAQLAAACEEPRPAS
ncbi:MarR family winged helix-turn-helix transcriptional regulator [Williamsia muralis]|uniref:MarR family winged helix-turn-helix transcriptional regulator n=1 Tax=Williamsia marianensis TaxID=85044 RepID=UPI00382C438E